MPTETGLKEVKKITDHITHLEYMCKRTTATAFMRFQEHYEGPYFRGKVFTIGQYKDWYSRENGGNTYEHDWGGFNIPDYVLSPFIKGLFDPLTEAEKEIVELFRYRTDKFYVIGTGVGEENSIDHEICHALYYTVPKYKIAVDEALDEWDLTEIEDWLKNHGYCEEVLQDECHAYISADSKYLEKMGVTPGDDLHKKLRKIRKRFFKD